LVTILEGRRPLGRPKHRWEDYNQMDIKEIGLEGVDWIHLAHDTDQCKALVNTVMNFGVLQEAEILTE
jgi:hypothetical protein